MTLILRDSIDAPLIPTDTPVVAGYGDGLYLWSPSYKDGSNWFDLFPNSVKLVIVVSAADVGDILDVETGDARPDQVPDWCNRFNRPGRRAPTIYCNRDTWPLVIDALRASGNNPAGPHIDYWIGTLDGSKTVTVPPGGKPPVAVQYVDTGAYDESIIYDPSWVGGDMLDDTDKAWLLANVFTANDRSQLDGLWRGWFTDDGKMNALQAAVAALSQPTVDVNALAAALVPLIGKPIAQELGKALEAAP